MSNRTLHKHITQITSILSLFLAGFHLAYISGIITFSTMTLRSIHITIMMILSFLGILVKQEDIEKKQLLLVAIGVLLSALSGGYILARWETIVTSGGLINGTDPYMGLLMIIILVFLTYKMIGKSLAIIVSLFFIYPFVGQYLIGMFRIKGYSFERVIGFLYTTTQGIFGIPLGVAASYIIFFCIFGGFLSNFGVGDFMFKFSRKLTSGLVASTAKTAVAFSGFMGMVSGTAAGNVAVTGSLTIPMMKKSGYKSHEAAAIEAVSSTGGQIMPPIMGAAAFIMAEMTNTKYNIIMKSAIVPALLFFISIYIIVHLISLRDNIDINKKEEEKEQSMLQLLKQDGYLLLPIISLIALMLVGYSPLKSALFSIIIMLVLHLVVKRDFTKAFIDKILLSVISGVKSTMLISIACGVSGIIVGVISITGVGSKLSALIVSSSGGSIFIALLLTMITSIILGMGLPTTAAYLIPVSVIAPALVQMGVPLLTAHMFIFIFACISTITPPVALASYVAAGIGDANINKVGWTAFRFGLASYILPFMLIYNPNIMLSGNIGNIILSIIIGLSSIFCIAVSVVGFYKRKLNKWTRICLLILGLILVRSSIIAYVIGISIMLYFLVIKIKKKE